MNEIQAKQLLQNIPVKHTMVINGHPVTRWSETAFEVGTWGRKTVDIDQAIPEVQA